MARAQLEVVEYCKVWDGAAGWYAFPEHGRGALLPPYASATTLTEATQELSVPLERGRGEITTQRRYTPEEKMQMRRQFKAGVSPHDIAREFGSPLATVKRIVDAYGWNRKATVRSSHES